MLKKRIIPILLYHKRRLVKSIKFRNFRDVGDPVKTAKVFSDQDADELILLNIERCNNIDSNFFDVVRKISNNCFVPLTIGGGIRELKDVKKLFESGADKVVVNSTSFSKKELLQSISDLYGNQSLVVGVDTISDKQNNTWTLNSFCGQREEYVDLDDHLNSVMQYGVGEIFIQSITNDGEMSGFDLQLIRKVKSLISVPLIVGGGSGNFQHLKKAFDSGADAVACGSLFNFGDNNPLRAKAFLKNYDIPLKKI